MRRRSCCAIVARSKSADDASEADAAVLEWQQKRWEPVRADESLNVLEAWTDDPGSEARLTHEIQCLLR